MASPSLKQSTMLRWKASAGAGVLEGEVLERVTGPPSLLGDQRDAVEGQEPQRQLGVLDLLARDGNEPPSALGGPGLPATTTSSASTSTSTSTTTCPAGPLPVLRRRLHAPELPLLVHVLALQDHEALESAAVYAAVEGAPPLHRARPHEEHVGRPDPVDRDRGWKAELAAARARVQIHGVDEDPLDEDQPLAVVPRAGPFLGMGTFGSRHRSVHGVVDVPLHDEEPGHPTGHLVVGGAVGVGVVPVRARGVGSGRLAERCAVACGAKEDPVVRLGHPLVRTQGAQRRVVGAAALPPVAVGDDAKEDVVRKGSVGVGVGSDVQAVEVEIGGVGRALTVGVVHQGVARDPAGRYDRVCLLGVEERVAARRFLARWEALGVGDEPAHFRGVVRDQLRRVGTRAHRSELVVGVQMVAQADQHRLVPPGPDGGPRRGASEAEKGRERIPRRR